MAAITKQLKVMLGFERYENIVYGRLNDIYFNVRFIRHKKGTDFRSLADVLTEPKYDSVMIDAFAFKNNQIDLAEVNRFLELNYRSTGQTKLVILTGAFPYFSIKTTP